jgi:predicted DNA-binding transcriptional regulator YafY
MNKNKSERRIRRLGLWFWGKVWTLIAWCEMRGDFRMFRTDRIEGVTDGPVFRPERDKTLTAVYAKQRAQGLPDAGH